MKRCLSGVGGSQLKCHYSKTKLWCQDSAAAACTHSLSQGSQPAVLLEQVPQTSYQLYCLYPHKYV